MKFCGTVASGSLTLAQLSHGAAAAALAAVLSLVLQENQTREVTLALGLVRRCADALVLFLRHSAADTQRFIDGG
jgi:hypothetical protein